VDFVVAGFGLGAVMMLIGFAVRDLGPLRYRRSEDDPATTWQWSALSHTVGRAIVAGGFAVCLVTLVMLVIGAGDDTGARMVASIAAVAVIGSGVWSVFAIRRFTETVAARSAALGSGRTAVSFGSERRAVQPAPTEWDESAPLPPFRKQEPAADDVAPISPGAIDEVQPATAEATVPATTPQPATTPPPTPDAALAIDPQPEPRPETSARPPVYASPLLADVDTNAPVDNGTGFRSSLLADLAADVHGEAKGSGFTSSVLADLAGEDVVQGPPAPAESMAIDPTPLEQSDKESPEGGASSANEDVSIADRENESTSESEIKAGAGSGASRSGES
jgi:hypothetical protein